MSKSITIHFESDIEKMAPNQKKPPDSIKGHCTKCGKCCEFYRCPAYDPEEKKCRIYGARPIACRMWPHAQEDIDEAGCTGYHQHGI